MKRRGILVAFFGVFVASGGVCQADLSIGLVAYYPFNGNGDDESTLGNHLTVAGATLTMNRFGEANSAYSFDGNDQLFSAGPLPLLENTTHTVSAWVRSTASSEAGILDLGLHPVSQQAPSHRDGGL
jgi:hypothetical protein